jgi:hypothetical protein
MDKTQIEHWVGDELYNALITKVIARRWPP